MYVELYTKTSCSYCNMAKKVLREAQIPFHEYKLNEDFTRETLLEKFPGVRTYPVVVLDGMNIGGYTELHEQLSSRDNRKFLTE